MAVKEICILTLDQADKMTSKMCDDYCKYRHTFKDEDEQEEFCKSCPLNALFDKEVTVNDKKGTN